MEQGTGSDDLRSLSASQAASQIEQERSPKSLWGKIKYFFIGEKLDRKRLAALGDLLSLTYSTLRAEHGFSCMYLATVKVSSQSVLLCRSRSCSLIWLCQQCHLWDRQVEKAAELYEGRSLNSFLLLLIENFACSNELALNSLLPTGMAVSWIAFARRTGKSPLMAGQWKPFLTFFAGALL